MVKLGNNCSGKTLLACRGAFTNAHAGPEHTTIVYGTLMVGRFTSAYFRVGGWKPGIHGGNRCVLTDQRQRWSSGPFDFITCIQVELLGRKNPHGHGDNMQNSIPTGGSNTKPSFSHVSVVHVLASSHERPSVFFFTIWTEFSRQALLLLPTIRPLSKALNPVCSTSAVQPIIRRSEPRLLVYMYTPSINTFWFTFSRCSRCFDLSLVWGQSFHLSNVHFLTVSSSFLNSYISQVHFTTDIHQRKFINVLWTGKYDFALDEIVLKCTSCLMEHSRESKINQRIYNRQSNALKCVSLSVQSSPLITVLSRV